MLTPILKLTLPTTHSYQCYLGLQVSRNIVHVNCCPQFEVVGITGRIGVNKLHLSVRQYYTRVCMHTHTHTHTHTHAHALNWPGVLMVNSSTWCWSVMLNWTLLKSSSMVTWSSTSKQQHIIISATLQLLCKRTYIFKIDVDFFNKI